MSKLCLNYVYIMSKKIYICSNFVFGLNFALISAKLLPSCLNSSKFRLNSSEFFLHF